MNTLNLTDEQLNVVMTGLDVIVATIQDYIDKYGIVGLEDTDLEVFNEATRLHNQLEKKFYEELV